MEGLGAVEQIELQGLDIDQISGSDELIAGLGAVAKANPRRARQALMKASAVTKRKSFAQGKVAGQAPLITGDITSRGWFELKKGELPEPIRKSLASGGHKAVDMVLYGIKAIDNQQVVNLFTSSDDKQVGRSNVNGAKLDANAYFLATELVIDFGTYTDVPSDSTFGEDYPAEIKNGEFEFQIGDVKMIPDAMSMESFNQEGVITKRSHVLKLASPKWITPQIEMKPKLYLTKAGGAKQAVKFIIMGTMVSNR